MINICAWLHSGKESWTSPLSLNLPSKADAQSNAKEGSQNQLGQEEENTNNRTGVETTSQLRWFSTTRPHSWQTLLLPPPDHSGSMLPDTPPALPGNPTAWEVGAG